MRWYSSGGKRRPQRRAADERRADGREASSRGLPRAVGVHHPRAGDAAARVLRHERVERGDGARLGHRVRVRDHDVLARSSPRSPGSRSRRTREGARSRARASPPAAARPSRGCSRRRRARRPARARAGSECSSSAAWPCETTTAEITAGAPDTSAAVSRAVSSQVNRFARSSPAADRRSESARAIRTPRRGRRRRTPPRRRRPRAGPRRGGRRPGVPQAIASTSGRPNPS